MKLGNTRETVIMAMESLRANRLRSALTVLGVIIGVATVIIISSVINGLNNKVAKFASTFGTNVIWAARLPFDVQPTPELLARRYLTLQEGQDMRALPHVVAANVSANYVDPVLGVGSTNVKYNGKSTQQTILEGDTYQMPMITDLPMKEGSMFTQTEEEHASDVTVLGCDAAKKLFGEGSAIGKDVDIDGDIFTVIGVMKPHKQLFGSGPNPQDNIAYMPLTTFHKIHPEQKDLQLTVRYDQAANQYLVEEEMRTLLRIARKVPTSAQDDFYITTPDFIMSFWSQITGGLVLFMVAVSSVGLMVGGVGVMNIMLVSVTERTREIGVRKAIGATRGSVLLQFTLEAVALCAVGGALGVAVGGLVTLIIREAVAALPASMSVAWTTISFSVSCLIGLVFGIYPAWKAATLNPIEALRYE